MSDQMTEAEIPLLPYGPQCLPISLLICQKNINVERIEDDALTNMTQIRSHFAGFQMGENPKLLAVEQRVEDSKLNMDFDFLTSNLFLQSYSHLPSFLVIDIATVR